MSPGRRKGHLFELNVGHVAKVGVRHLGRDGTSAFFCTISITFSNKMLDIWQKWGCGIWEETEQVRFFALKAPLLELLRPAVDHRCRAEHKARPLVMVMHRNRDRLQRLPQSHLVAQEDAPIPRDALRNALALEGEERGGEAGARRGRVVRHRPEDEEVSARPAQRGHSCGERTAPTLLKTRGVFLFFSFSCVDGPRTACSGSDAALQGRGELPSASCVCDALRSVACDRRDPRRRGSRRSPRARGLLPPPPREGCERIRDPDQRDGLVAAVPPRDHHRRRADLARVQSEPRHRLLPRTIDRHRTLRQGKHLDPHPPP